MGGSPSRGSTLVASSSLAMPHAALRRRRQRRQPTSSHPLPGPHLPSSLHAALHTLHLGHQRPGNMASRGFGAGTSTPPGQVSSAALALLGGRRHPTSTDPLPAPWYDLQSTQGPVSSRPGMQAYRDQGQPWICSHRQHTTGMQHRRCPTRRPRVPLVPPALTSCLHPMLPSSSHKTLHTGSSDFKQQVVWSSRGFRAATSSPLRSCSGMAVLPRCRCHRPTSIGPLACTPSSCYMCM